MQRTGAARLPLHYGKAPRYLVVRMQKLAKEIVTVIIEEYGCDEFLRRVSDPFWFQALGCVLGYDWHSSGVTTVLTGVLKKAIDPKECGMAVCGGKGRFSRLAPDEIQSAGEEFGFPSQTIESLQYASRMSAKVDNAAIQAGYQLYHHTFFVGQNRRWAVVQQGMCAHERTARRYHWLSDSVRQFVVEPHSAIVGDSKHQRVLNMVAKESEGNRKASVDIVRESPKRLMRLFVSSQQEMQRTLDDWLLPTAIFNKEHPLPLLNMPLNINWNTMQRIFDFQPRNYEELLGFKGVGPATVRGLALIADLIYGEKPSWKDPVKYSFAYGGKDGVPYPVNRKAMDESISILKQAVQEAKVGDIEKTYSLQRLRCLLPSQDDSKTCFP